MSLVCRCLVVATLAFVAASCGGSGSRSGSRAAAPSAAATSPCHADTAAAKKWLPRLRADVAAIRRSKTHDAASRTTDRFIADLERPGISLTTENRLIDLGISARLGKCHDCFEGLEAMRPIPSLASHRCR